MHIPNRRTATATPPASLPVPALFLPANSPQPTDAAARPVGPKPTPVTFSDVRVPMA